KKFGLAYIASDKPLSPLPHTRLGEREGTSGGHATQYVHDSGRRLGPSAVDLDAMRQIAQVTEHAGVLKGALLLGLVGAVLGMGADEGEDALEDGCGQRSEFGG